VSAKTVKRERGDLLTLWRFAYKQGLCRESPIDVPTVKIARRNPNSWTAAEYTALLATCAGLRGEMRATGISKAAWWGSLSTFLYWIGCRIGAALAIRPADMDLRRRLVRLRAEGAKTGIEQTLLLHPQAVAAVASIYSPDRQRVWPYPYSRRRLWEHYKQILRRAGLPSDRSSMFQRTRRTTYTLCVKYGSKEVASRQLGHKTDMSRYYLDESQLDIQQAATVLPPLT
jgi:integrase